MPFAATPQLTSLDHLATCKRAAERCSQRPSAAAPTRANSLRSGGPCHEYPGSAPSRAVPRSRRTAGLLPRGTGQPSAHAEIAPESALRFACRGPCPRRPLPVRRAAAGSDQLQALQPPTCFAPSPAARAPSPGRVQPPTAPARAGGPAARGPRILSDDGGRVVGADDPFQGARRRPRAGLRVAAAGRRTAADARQASRPADGGAAAAVIPSGSRKQDASAGIPFLSECIRRGARRASGIAVLERPLLERTQQSMEQKRNHHARHVWIHNRPGFRDL